jgi:glycosyltransferase involved in cell wall biosynthesis
MRVGLVIYGDLSHASGGFLYDRMMVESLREAGDAVDVLSLPWRGYGRCLLQNFDPRVRSRVADWNGDLLLQDELVHPSLFILNRTLRGTRRIPRVSIVHHLRTSEGPAGRAFGVYRAVEREFLAGAGGFIFNSEVTRRSVQELAGQGCTGIVVTPGGDRLGPGISEADAFSRAGEAGPLRVLFVGTLIPRKGLLELVAALGRLPPAAWRLTVAGSSGVDPGYAERVRRAVKELDLQGNVRMCGHLADAGLAAELRVHHVLAVPSLYEGFGIVYLEAMGFGVVPIGARTGGAAEVIRDGESGCLVPPGDVGALADSLRRLCEDRGRLRALAGGALARFREFPGWREGMARAREHLHTLARDRGTT